MNTTCSYSALFRDLIAEQYAPLCFHGRLSGVCPCTCLPLPETCPPLPNMLAFDLPGVPGDGRRVPAHKLNAVSGDGRRVPAFGLYAVPGDLPATRLPSPSTWSGLNAGMRGNGGQVAVYAGSRLRHSSVSYDG
ncbi:MAG: hypothetical protein JRJ38_12745 [Deltaproteobacteria bacterium]|nr:hypothetical protein [Deltaproteobacteria bacterium]